jgi:acetyltransferase
MSLYNLDKIFRPDSIAVIGAGERSGSIGAALMRNLIQGGFTGKIYPINPKHSEIMKMPAYPSVKDIKAPVDLGIVATPITSAPQIVKECAEADVGGVVIISAGGKEIGEAGKNVEAAIQKAAAHSGLRIVGPNCLGIICSALKLNASFASHMTLPGKMAFISQSGAICTAILDLSIKENIGFSYFVSLGSMLDVDFGDMIDYLGSEPGVSSIVMYVESLTHFRKFMSAARAVSRVKPIIALKAGRTRSGAAAAASHTGALAGEDAVYDAAFKRAGILRVKTFEELFDCAELLAKQPKPTKPGLAIITNAGGPGVMAADALSDYGVEPVQLSVETIKRLDEILPPYWSKRNPIDMLGDATLDIFQKVVDICLDAREIDGLLIMTAPQALTDPTDVAASLVDHLKGTSFPVFTCWLGGTDMEKGRDIFNRAEIPTFDSPERAVRAFMDLYRYSCNIEMLQQIPSRLPKRLEFDRPKAYNLIRKGLDTKNQFLTELETKALLSTYGIPVCPTQAAASVEEAMQKSKAMGFPVVMKINSRDITHKSDAKGVVLDLKNEQDVREAFKTVMKNALAYNSQARIEGVSIQPMVKRPDYELIIGAKKDRDFGPVILFGMGGIFTEILKDRAIALPPLNRLLARRLMEDTHVYRLLKGYRNIAPANLMLVEEILIRLAQLVTDFSEIEELDINPFIITQKGACALDARVLLKPDQPPAPMHLVISPYPDRYETHTRTSMGNDIFVRPIRPEDAPLLVELFESLSPRSVYLRFFSPIKSLSHSMLARFTQIDYDREMALIALAETGQKERILGVSRIISEVRRNQAEFAVVVGDPWQGKGIGAELLKRCLSIAKERGIEKVEGTVLAENIQMLSLGRKLGFKITRAHGGSEYELSIETQSLP